VDTKAWVRFLLDSNFGSLRLEGENKRDAIGHGVEGERACVQLRGERERERERERGSERVHGPFTRHCSSHRPSRSP
jgi:hypothetical protein